MCVWALRLHSPNDITESADILENFTDLILEGANDMI